MRHGLKAVGEEHQEVDEFFACNLARRGERKGLVRGAAALLPNLRQILAPLGSPCLAVASERDQPRSPVAHDTEDPPTPWRRPHVAMSSRPTML